jgi:hypothetical protein
VKARKLGKREQRAAQFIASRVEYSSEGSFLLEVEWKRSATWGSNPHVYDFDGSDCVSVSGCGYCKLSTAVANMLRHLPGLTAEESSAVWGFGGIGESSILAKFEAATGGKWAIVRHYSSKSVDVYRVTRVGVAS